VLKKEKFLVGGNKIFLYCGGKNFEKESQNIMNINQEKSHNKFDQKDLSKGK